MRTLNLNFDDFEFRKLALKKDMLCMTWKEMLLLYIRLPKEVIIKYQGETKNGNR
jgi:hypothetical protein